MKKHIIWTNDINIKDWQEYIEELKEECEEITESEIYDRICELNNDYLDDERSNLDINTPGKIIAIANIGRWDGRKQGYKIYNELPDIFESECDLCSWYVEGNRVKFEGSHHDGTNYVEYRILRENRNTDNFINKIYNGEQITKGLIQYYTKPLAPYIKKVYGWR